VKEDDLMTLEPDIVSDKPIRKGRPVQMDAEDRRDLILDTVEEFMVGCGLQQTSMDAVAKRAGMSKRTVYELFGSRESLFTECLIRRSHRMLPALTPCQKGLALPQRLEELLTFNLTRVSARQSVEMLRSVISAARDYPALGRHIQKACMGRLYDLVADELTEGVRRGEVSISRDEVGIHASLLTDMALENPLVPLLDPDAVFEDTEEKKLRRRLAVSIYLAGLAARPSSGMSAAN
jgi:AcrR family transcriptional regulator